MLLVQKHGIFAGCLELFPASFNQAKLQPELSGKLQVLDCLLALVRVRTDDKFVLVSNYTQTLDVFEQLCALRRYKFVRLDGSMNIRKRGKIVKEFNDAQVCI